MKYRWFHFWELLWAMTEKELRSRYKHTVFGFIWLVATPILQMFIIGFVFTFLLKEPAQHYYFFLFNGLLLWNFFSTALTKTTPSIVFERELIKKARFPHAIIPLSIVFSTFIHYLLAFGIFALTLPLLENAIQIHPIELFFGITLLITFTVGLSFLFSAYDVQYRDVAFFVQALLVVWFYATPIIYSLTMIPRRLLWLWWFNPLTSILQLLQHGLLGLPGPGLAMFTANILVIAIVTALGVIAFTKESRYFDDWL